MIKRVTGRLAILAFALSMLHSTGSALAGPEGTFTGSWTASGAYQLLEFEEGREVFTFRVSGHVNLKNEMGEIADYWSECTGLWDAETGSTTRCVWRDADGQSRAFSVLEGRIVEEGVKVAGRFVGGSGKLQGLTGALSFTWTSVFRNRANRMFTGHTENLSGSYQLP
jgi:hypothetical protein